MLAYARVRVLHGNGEARRRPTVTRLVAKPPVAEPRVADRRRYKVEVVVDELTPLHEHVGVEVVGGDAGGGDEAHGDGARAGKACAVVEAVWVPACAPALTSSNLR